MSEGETYYDENKEAAQIDPEYKRFLTDLHFVASTAEGQRVLMHILGALGTFECAWHPKNAQMAKAVVLKDFGQEILDDLAVASDVAHDEIQRAMRIARKAGLTDQIFATK
ncbi:MAG: hypothetical protein GY753_11960 [Gammaproteobacteria bacterium]|nr:hypothetical protein [Gammaproteobacteria bacterium]